MGREKERRREEQRAEEEVHEPPLEPKQGVYGSGGSYGMGGGFEEDGATFEVREPARPVIHKGPVPTND